MRSRTSSFASSCALALLSLLLALGCGSKKTAIAELKKAEGPVERQVGTGNWAGAKIGTKYYLGDAARTAEGGAQLEVVGNALIAMQPRTILRFGGTDKSSKIAVELGTIELTGTGSYGFDLGDVRLSRNGTVRITANPGGKPKVELTIGEAQVSTASGQTIDLVVGSTIEIGLETIAVTAIDAGVPDVAAVAVVVVDAGVEPDAAPVTGEGVVVDATGKRVEVQLPGETKWTVLPVGAGALPKGAKLRVGTGSSAKLTSLGTTLEMAGGSRVTVGENQELVIETGDIRAFSTGDGKVALPGGELALKGTPNAAAEANLAVGSRDSRVTMARGNGKLAGAPGSELEMNRGETATLAKAGTIRVIEAIPNYFDFRVDAGDTLTIHDPRPPTAVQFAFAGKCPDGGIIEMDKDTRYKTAKISGGKEAANLSVGSGSWAYRLRCTSGGSEGNAVASGRIVVKRDDGRRALPKVPPLNSIDADGRTWRLSYQSQIPNLQVNTKATGSSFKLHLATEGKEQTFDSKKPAVTVPGSQLKEGTYAYWFDIDGVKQPKTSTLIFNFDQTAPQVYVELPVNGKPWGEDIDVKGAVMQGWTASVDGNTIPLDGGRRFIAKAQKPSGNALAIKLSHPSFGTHYYLRRAK
ncbi:MAG: hypothetical protein M4D80_01305 [Myxococcota bacterium]|nr:hypothetical protein [Myxococcota bacterium]